MGLISILRRLYISTTNLTHGYQGQPEKLLTLYRLWSPLYDLSLRFDPGYATGIQRMVDTVVRPDDTVLDIGCGTGIATIGAAKRARRVVGIDPSSEMLARLRHKIDRQGIRNIELVNGFFPDSLESATLFDVVISSFAIVHIERDSRRETYAAMFDHLKRDGRVGTFSAQGEIAPAFETRDEVYQSLEAVGFQKIEITEVSDIYRIVTAVKE